MVQINSISSSSSYRNSAQPVSTLVGNTNNTNNTNAVSSSTNSTSGQQQLSSSDQETVRELKQRDAKVRAHEEAHVAAGGGYIRGGPNYTYERGPDGQMYAVGGDVKIDTSADKDPEVTIRKMEVVRAAALAPADPSGQDRAVAAEASMEESQAEAELAQAKHGNGNEVGTQVDVFA